MKLGREKDDLWVSYSHVSCVPRLRVHCRFAVSTLFENMTFLFGLKCGVLQCVYISAGTEYLMKQFKLCTVNLYAS